MKRIAPAESTVESLIFYTYTSSPGKILFTNPSYLRLIKINTSTKMNSDQTPGRTGQQEATRPEGIEQDTVQKCPVANELCYPTYFCSGSETQTTFPELEQLSTTTHNGRGTNLTMWVKPTGIRHGSLFFHTPDN